MKIQFYAKNTDIPASLKTTITKKLEKIKKYKTGVKDVLVVQVDVSRDAHHKKGDVFRVEINIDVPGKQLLRVAETAGTVLDALDTAAHKLERQARDLKEKAVSDKKRGK